MAITASYAPPKESMKTNFWDFPLNYVPAEVLERILERTRRLCNREAISRSEVLSIDPLEILPGKMIDLILERYSFSQGSVEALKYEERSKEQEKIPDEVEVLFIGFSHADKSGLLKMLEDFSLNTSGVITEEV